MIDPPKPLPPLSWSTEQGAKAGLADFAGKGVVLNFWATWCGPCVKEMPSLAQLAQALKPADIVVLPVSADSEGAPAVRRFYAAHEIEGLPVLLDPSQAASTAAGVFGLPTTLIINRAGREVAVLAGGADWMRAGTAETVKRLCGA